MGNHSSTAEFISKAKLVHQNKYDYSKVNYINHSTKVCIICPIHGEFWQRPSLHLKGHGCEYCNKSEIRRNLLYNIAIIDVKQARSPEYVKSYEYWSNMISRCYSPYMLKKYPTYKTCSVCSEWLLFSNFHKWFQTNYIDGYDLDKDILYKGNKIYSPQTCCFVPHKIKCTINKCQSSRGDLPLGVYYDKSRGKYYASFKRGMKSKFIGRFSTLEEAFAAYKLTKEQYIKELAEKYFQEGKITKKVYDALFRYEVEITD